MNGVESGGFGLDAETIDMLPTTHVYIECPFWGCWPWG